MKKLDPIIKSTILSPDGREWIPTTTDNILWEVDHIVKAGEEDDHSILFRGQCNSDWLLDSTLVRDGISKLFGIANYQTIPNSIRQQVSFHRLMASILLMKFGTIWKPSKEAFEKEQSHGIDPWFELLKNVQQYPENYNNIVYFTQGTSLVDWTVSQDIGLYFAVFDGVRDKRQIAPTDGALWIYDSSSTGKILQEVKVEKILNLMAEANFLNGERTLPLMFHPSQQTRQLRAENQKPIYIAQMDFRYDLADVWASYESQGNERVFVKLHIQQHLKPGLAKHLDSKSITEDYVYPH